ncbi:MAG: hypothetical protein ACK59X_30770 [Acidovorax sp.]
MNSIDKDKKERRQIDNGCHGKIRLIFNNLPEVLAELPSTNIDNTFHALASGLVEDRALDRNHLAARAGTGPCARGDIQFAVGAEGRGIEHGTAHHYLLGIATDDLGTLGGRDIHHGGAACGSHVRGATDQIDGLLVAAAVGECGGQGRCRNPGRNQMLHSRFPIDSSSACR